MVNGLRYTIFKTDWGYFGLLADNKGLLKTVLATNSFEKTKKSLLADSFGHAKEEKNLNWPLQKFIKNYYAKNCEDFKKTKFSISLNGLSHFAKKIINACKEIPFGQTLTYAQLAKRAGFPKAVRAVGAVLSKNPLPLIVPCHRVIRADGKIGNFSAPGGSKTKKKMLENEKIATKTPRQLKILNIKNKNEK